MTIRRHTREHPHLAISEISLNADARSVRLKIEVPHEVGRYLARKGAVCVDGVSLTINEVSAQAFYSVFLALRRVGPDTRITARPRANNTE